MFITLLCFVFAAAAASNVTPMRDIAFLFLNNICIIYIDLVVIVALDIIFDD